MNAFRIKWPTGHVEARADIRSKDEHEVQIARLQARTIKTLLGLSVK
jgi:hypothetical protein